MYCRNPHEFYTLTKPICCLWLLWIWFYYSLFFSALICFPIHTALSPPLPLLSSKFWVTKTGYSGASCCYITWITEAEESLEHWALQQDLSQNSIAKSKLLWEAFLASSPVKFSCALLESHHTLRSLWPMRVCSLLWIVLNFSCDLDWACWRNRFCYWLVFIFHSNMQYLVQRHLVDTRNIILTLLMNFHE